MNNSSSAQVPVEYLASWAIIILDIIYVLIVIVGLTGNIMTCAVTIMQKSMRRSIHLYVFNLAVCDLLILIFYVPNEMMRMGNHARFVWGPVMCVITYSVLPIAINGTVFTLLAISLDRTRGIVHPFEWRNGPDNYPKIIIPIIWIVGISIAFPVIYFAQLIEFNTGYACVDEWPNKSASLIYWYTMFAITFAIPLVIIFFLHLLMVYVLAKEPVLVEQKANKKMIKMMIWIVGIFTICTGSQHVYFFILQNVKVSTKVDGILFFGSNLLVAVQSACNPILYGTFRQDFNLAFKEFYIKVKKFLISYDLNVCGKFQNPYAKVNMVTTAMVLRKQIPNGDSDVVVPFGQQCSYRTPLINNKPAASPQYMHGKSSHYKTKRDKSSTPDFQFVSLTNTKNDLDSRSRSVDGKVSILSKDSNVSNERRNDLDSRSRSVDSKASLISKDSSFSNDGKDFRPYVWGQGDIRKNPSTDSFTKVPGIGNTKKISFSDIDSTRSYSPYDNCADDKSSEITKQLQEISKLLNALQRQEFLENCENRARLSCEFLRLNDTEKDFLCASYPNVDWLDLLTIENSKETNL